MIKLWHEYKSSFGLLMIWLNPNCLSDWLITGPCCLAEWSGGSGRKPSRPRGRGTDPHRRETRASLTLAFLTASKIEKMSDHIQSWYCAIGATFLTRRQKPFKRRLCTYPESLGDLLTIHFTVEVLVELAAADLETSVFAGLVGTTLWLKDVVFFLALLGTFVVLSRLLFSHFSIVIYC